MRVVSGKYGSRSLESVSGQNTRPTTDKIKESVFNLLGNYFDGGVCLDFYAGSGAMGIEAVSRGMDMSILCEKYKPAQAVIEKNINITKEADRFVLLRGNNRKSVQKYMEDHKEIAFSLIVLDPPYHQQAIVNDIEWLIEQTYLTPQAIIICETDKETELPEKIREFHVYKFKNYGQTNIYLYERNEEVV